MCVKNDIWIAKPALVALAFVMLPCKPLWHTPLLRKFLASHGDDRSCNVLASHGATSSCHSQNGVKKGMKIANQLSNCNSL